MFGFERLGNGLVLGFLGLVVRKDMTEEVLSTLNPSPVSDLE